MAEAILLPVVNSILAKIASFTGEITCNYVTDEIKHVTSVTKDIDIIADELKAISAVLQDADEKQYANHAIKVWLSDLKSVVYDIDDLLDEIAYDALERSVNKGHLRSQLRYYLTPSSNPLVNRFQCSRKIRDLKEKLDHVVGKKNKFGLTERPIEASPIKRDPLDGCAFVNESNIIGRENAKTDIIDMLSQDDSETITPRVLPIVGLGGIGKTALAKIVYNDMDQLDFEIKSWVCVSDKFDPTKLLIEILKGAINLDYSNHTLSQLVTKLKSTLKDRKYFLVFDDVWIDEISTWRDLLSLFPIGGVGSAILITTRSEKVASMTQTIGSYNLDGLSSSHCWCIFKDLAFKKDDEEKFPNLVKIGKSIIEKCSGVPLIVKCLASLLQGKRDEWEWKQILDLEKSSMKVSEQYDYVMRVLKLSYDKLPSHLKPCFAYSPLLAKDTTITILEQTSRWSALGLLHTHDKGLEIEDYAHSNISELVSRSLFHEPESIFFGKVSSCKIHDLLHDLAVSILGDELAFVNWEKLQVSTSSMHILWDYEGIYDSQSDNKEFPIQLLKANKARTFRFMYHMGIVSHSFIDTVISNFTRLRMLSFGGADFEVLPDSIGNLKHLRYLDLSYNPLLKKIPKTIAKLLNLECLRTFGCDQLEELPECIYKLLKLRTLLVTTCQMSLFGKKFNKLRSLRQLTLGNCLRLESLWEDVDVGRLSSLRQLFIYNCPKLKALPNSMKLLCSLEQLIIINCDELDLGVGEGLSGLTSLRRLMIGVLPRLLYLPQTLHSASGSLQDLTIGTCEWLVELPNWLQSFTSLLRIEIGYCPRLSALPEGIRHLNGLQRLMIEDCPNLSSRCVKPSGEDYHLIQHVPEIVLDEST